MIDFEKMISATCKQEEHSKSMQFLDLQMEKTRNDMTSANELKKIELASTKMSALKKFREDWGEQLDSELDNNEFAAWVEKELGLPFLKVKAKAQP